MNTCSYCREGWQLVVIHFQDCSREFSFSTETTVHKSPDMVSMQEQELSVTVDINYSTLSTTHAQNAYLMDSTMHSSQIS